ncbi:MAG: protein-glutamine glutaminase family protein [Deltaproteobacteria bacterium]|jgi:hypothetical protein
MPWWKPWGAPKVRSVPPPPEPSVAKSKPVSAAPDAPPSTGDDHVRARAAMRGLPALVHAFVDAHGYGPRIEAFRGGRPGLRPLERDTIERQLATLTNGQRQALREALVTRPPHPELARFAKHPAVSGAPSVANLLAILDGSVLGETVKTHVPSPPSHYAQFFRFGARVRTGAGEGTIHALTPDGQVRVRMHDGSLRDDEAGLLAHYNGELMTEPLKAHVIETQTPLDLRAPPLAESIASQIFSAGQSVAHGGVPGHRIEGFVERSGVVLLAKGDSVRSATTEVLLAANPALIPVGVELYAPNPDDGIVEGGWRVEGHPADGGVLMRHDDGATMNVGVEVLLEHNRQALLGDGVHTSPLALFAHDDRSASVSEVRAVQAQIGAVFEATNQQFTQTIEAQLHAPPDAARDDLYAQTGRVLADARQLSGALWHQEEPTHPKITRAELRRRSQAMIAGLNNIAASLAELPAAPGAPKSFEPPFSSNEEAKWVVEGSLAAIDRAYREPPLAGKSIVPGLLLFTRCAEEISTEPNGRIATRAEVDAVAKAAHADRRLHRSYLKTGCYARAQNICERLREQGVATAKMFVYPQEGMLMGSEYLTPKGSEESWTYHVASVAFVREGDEVQIRIVDPTFSDASMTLEEWGHQFLSHRNQYATFFLEPARRYELAMSDSTYADSVAESWIGLAALADLATGKRSL